MEIVKVYVDKKLRERLQREAAEQDRPVSQVARKLIEAQLAAQDKKGRK